MLRGMRSLRHRVFAGVLLTTVLALLVAGTLIVVQEASSYRERIIQDMTAQARLIGFASTPALQFNDRNLAKNNLELLKTRPGILAASIYSPSGKLFATYQKQPSNSNTFPGIPDADSYRIEGERLHVFHRIVANDEIVGTVYIRAHYQMYDILLQQAGLILAAILVALLVSMLLSFWLQSRLMGPILNIAGLAQRIARERDYSLRAEKSTSDEIGTLADAFNDLVSEVERGKEEMRLSHEELRRQVEDRRQAELEVHRLNTELENRVADRTADLERTNKELEAFSYSVSHDLRAPLRAIDGFSQAIMEDYAEHLDSTGKDYFNRVRAAAQRMGQLIDDVLKLSRINRAEFHVDRVDLSAMAEAILESFKRNEPDRQATFRVTSGMIDYADPRLIRIALENLLGNAWKYTSRTERTEIEFGMRNNKGETSYFVQDNGAGFDMEHAGRLFGAFQRLHDERDYAGTGIGLATVQRVIHRHGGSIWAEAEPGKGATFYFTLEVREPDETETDPAG